MTPQLLFKKQKQSHIGLFVCLFSNRCPSQRPHRWGRFPGVRSVTLPKQLARSPKCSCLAVFCIRAFDFVLKNSHPTPCHPFSSGQTSLLFISEALRAAVLHIRGVGVNRSQAQLRAAQIRILRNVSFLFGKPSPSVCSAQRDFPVIDWPLSIQPKTTGVQLAQKMASLMS